MPKFIHLNIHSEFSIIDGLVKIKSLMTTCVEKNMPAVAISDQMNLFSLVKFYKAALATGIKPIIAAHVKLIDEQQQKHRLLLLCQNHAGYQNLSELISRAYVEGQQDHEPLINMSWLVGATDGLIALSGAQYGNIGQALLANNQVAAESHLQQWQSLFPNRYYIELQRVGHVDEHHYIPQAIALAVKHHVPVVATNAVRFLTQDDFFAHEARVAIHDGYTLADPRRPKIYTAQQYLRSEQEMQALFADIPQALQNSVEIAKRCNMELILGKVSLPNFPVPKGMTVADYLRKEAEKGLLERLPGIDNVENKTASYQQRLNRELEVIIKMGFSGYFLIVADFIRWAKEQDIPVGPG
ncbi:MAG: PHP domain-containing protein, partial [Gammaproteobacteria bacterium]|nr:PHP domain-containing protein [Gammaproteobacteria bacterium]